MRKWSLLTVVLAMGCGGSLRSDVLLASARAEYPDCDQVEIAEREGGVQQWMVICGERRLFGLRSEQDVARERANLPANKPFPLLLHDQSGAIAWSSAQRSDTSVSARLRPLRVELTMLGVGQSAFLVVEAPHACASDPQVIVDDAPRALDSSPTSSPIGARTRFVQRLDLATLRVLASEPFDLSHCGQRHTLDAETAAMVRAWAEEQVASTR